MSNPADGPDVYKPEVRVTGPAKANVANVTTTKSGQVSGERRDSIV
jgi:hypothetical protein